MATPEPIKRCYYVTSLGQRLHITTSPDDPWTYNLRWEVGEAKPSDTVLKDRVDLDVVYDELCIQPLTPSLRFVNKIWRITQIDRIHHGRQIPDEQRRRWDAPRR